MASFEAWQKDVFFDQISLQNLDTISLITKHFDIADLLDLIKGYPQPTTPQEAQTLSDVLGIVAAVILDSHEGSKVANSSSIFTAAADPFNVRPSIDDVTMVLNKVQSIGLPD